MRPVLSSMTRISDLDERPFELKALPRADWATGDYVAARVLDDHTTQVVELPTGRFAELTRDDVVIGALGRRHATLELTGSWEDVGDDGRIALLTGGGLMGRCTSRSPSVPRPARLEYAGHVVRAREVESAAGATSAGGMADEGVAKVTMPSFALTHSASEPETFRIPTVMIIGTSMSAGKTATAGVLIRLLRRHGRRVVAAKVTGAGRYRDILTMGDAGAHAFFDFVDAGLPSTVCPEDTYRKALDGLLGRMSRTGADVAVIEVGASPLEPYNGALAVEKLQDAIRLCILCASDPYAVVGLVEAFGRAPDLVTGITANTRAGAELVEELAGVPCVDVRRRDAQPLLESFLPRLV